MLKPEERFSALNEVQFLKINHASDGQRIDNFLLKKLSGVPKTHVYKLLRKGQVRVNKGRVKPLYRLKIGDEVRLPPIRQVAKAIKIIPDSVKDKVTAAIIFENDDLIVFNKPAGLAVHAGTGVLFGLIETIRQIRQNESLELVHRLDRDTSGCLLVAKTRAALIGLQNEFRQKNVQKEYLALTKGRWEQKSISVHKSLMKNIMQSGERMVQIHEAGKIAVSHFSVIKQYKEVALVRVRIETGRTHQIRVHAAYLGHPVLGDDKYGDREYNKRFKSLGLRRMYLHSEELRFLFKTEYRFNCEADANWRMDEQSLLLS